MVSSASTAAWLTSSCAGERSRPTVRPLTARMVSPSRTSTPGASSGDPLPAAPDHVGGPEDLALQPPGLAEHLPPLRAGIDFDSNPTEVQPATGAARLVLVPVPVVRGVGLRRLGARLDRAQSITRAVDE